MPTCVLWQYLVSKIGCFTSTDKNAKKKVSVSVLIFYSIHCKRLGPSFLLYACWYIWTVVACIRSKTMVLAYKAIDGTAPAYLQALVKPHTPAWSLRSTTSAGRLEPPSLRATKGQSAKSQLFLMGKITTSNTPHLQYRYRQLFFHVKARAEGHMSQR